MFRRNRRRQGSGSSGPGGKAGGNGGNGGTSRLLMKANLRGPSALDRNRAPASETLAIRRGGLAAAAKTAEVSAERPKFELPPDDPSHPYDAMTLVKGSMGAAQCHILSFVGTTASANLHRLPRPLQFWKQLPEELFEERDVHEGEGSEFGSRQREQARRRRYERRLQNHPELREAAQLCFEDGESKEYVSTRRSSKSSGYRYFFVMPGAEEGVFQAVPADNYYEVRAKPKMTTFTEEEAEELMTKKSMTVTKLERKLEDKRQQEIFERRQLRERMKLVDNPDEDEPAYDDEESRDLARLGRRQRRTNDVSLVKSIEQDGEDDIDNVEDGFEPPAEDQVYAIPDQSDRVGMVQDSTLESGEQRLEMQRYFGEKEEEDEDEDGEPVDEDNDDVKEQQQEREHELKVLHGIEEEKEQRDDEEEEEEGGGEGEEDDDDVPSDFDPDEEPDDLEMEDEEDTSAQKPASQRGRKKKGQTGAQESKRKTRGRPPSSKRAKRG